MVWIIGKCYFLFFILSSMACTVNPLTGTLKPNRRATDHLYSRTVTTDVNVNSDIAHRRKNDSNDKWAVTFGTARRGPNGLRLDSNLAVPNVTAHSPINGQTECTNFTLFDVTLLCTLKSSFTEYLSYFNYNDCRGCCTTFVSFVDVIVLEISNKLI